MNSRTSSISSISDLFRPKKPKGLRSRDLSSTRLNALKKEIQTDIHLIPLSKYLKYHHLGIGNIIIRYLIVTMCSENIVVGRLGTIYSENMTSYVVWRIRSCLVSRAGKVGRLAEPSLQQQKRPPTLAQAKEVSQGITPH